jgi:hypothetical protein
MGIQNGGTQSLLEMLFTREEVNLIHSIPVSTTNREDVCILRGTKSGCFSVKSDYHIQMELEGNGQPETSTRQENISVWSDIWRLKVPNVEKTFLWRTCHDILPTQKNLGRRNILEDTSCPLCGLDEETTMNILWQCPSAVDTWSVGSVRLQKFSTNGSGFAKLVEEIFNSSPQEEIFNRCPQGDYG